MNKTQIAQSKKAIKKAVEIFGTHERLAEKLEIDASMISKWLANIKTISFQSAYKIDKLTNGQIKIKDLRPDLGVKREDD